MRGLRLAHYLPWFVSKPVSGVWGWHWSMGKTDPEKGQLATHDAPLIGPYDSGDPDALECQVLLMKLAGIDGVVIDWYGVDDALDYGVLHQNTQRLIPWLKKAGLRYAFCYEDQSVGQLVRLGKVRADDTLAPGKRALAWLTENAFHDPAYVTQNGRPVLLVFGPQLYEKPQWERLLGPIQPKPLLFGLPHLTEKSGCDGAFAWPPVSGGKTIAPETWRAYLSELYQRKTSVIAGAFPGFHDYYNDAGLHASYGFLDAAEGKTFAETLRRAEQSGAPLIQLATWNDYGEGTTVEPTVTLGYRYLEQLQRPPYRPDDLRLPVQLYQARKKGTARATLDAAAQRLFAGQCAAARTLLKKETK